MRQTIVGVGGPGLMALLIFAGSGSDPMANSRAKLTLSGQPRMQP